MTGNEARELINDVCMMTKKEIQAVTKPERGIILQACSHVNNLNTCTPEDIQDIKNARFLLNAGPKKRTDNRAA